MGFFRRLFRRRPEPAPIDEEEAYARSYGDRSGDIVRVERVEPDPESEPEPEPEPEPESEPEPEPEPEPVQADADDLTGELLRRAFELRLDTRRHSSAG